VNADAPGSRSAGGGRKAAMRWMLKQWRRWLDWFVRNQGKSPRYDRIVGEHVQYGPM
jgi:hypothetical protein